MDAAVRRFAGITAGQVGADFSGHPGAGAAGGLGFALMSYLPRVTLEPGILLALDTIGLAEDLKDADLAVTGEGRLDGQSARGKVPMGVGTLAKRNGVPVIALAGGVTPEARLCHEAGIDAYFSIPAGPCSLAEAMDPENARRNLERTAEEALRLIQAAR